uniref:Asl1-like glycosyl hydrolase catalytic domain-containing protein n=1 Tax=Chaetoceros debilis TaxID=122233 RepID=A0A7S3VFA0_9STRA
MRTSRSAFLLCTCAFLSNSKLASVTAESANSTFQQEDGNNDPSIGIAIDNKNITESPITAAPHTSATNNPLAGDSSPAFATTGTCSNDKSFRIIRKNGTADWCKWLEHRKKGARRRWCDKWNNDRLVKEACALSCGECSNDTPVQPPPVANSSKRGLIIGMRESERNVNHFKDSVSWFYNYSQWPSHWEGKWADANGIEFVPTIHKAYLTNRDLSPWCFFNSTQPTCSKQDAINTIRASINDRTNNGVAPRYLMGFNEMYNDPPPIDLTPAEAAIFWGKYVQPAAVANGLILVSPTTSNKDKGIKWFADFLKQCYDRRFQTDPCDIEIIKRFAVHEYMCYSDLFEEGYGGGSSELITGLAQQLGNYGGKNDWLAYLRNRDLWVTETNCFWESDAPHHDSKEQCLRATGQKWQTHGSGHLAKMNKMANVERYAWWTVWNIQTKPNYLTYRNGQLTPIGKAYLSPGNPKVDCEFPGVKLYARDATLTGTAELFTCKSTGTQMIRRGGKYKEQPGTVIFTVNVPSSGNYAINVSHLTVGARNLNVSVNNGSPAYHTFRSTSSSWCWKGGASTVVPLELTGLKAGMNKITFGGSMASMMPFIEWISVVV